MSEVPLQAVSGADLQGRALDCEVGADHLVSVASSSSLSLSHTHTPSLTHPLTHSLTHSWAGWCLQGRALDGEVGADRCEPNPNPEP
jgi:hypothetical protein